jgi:hypothetical protein
MQNDDTPPEAEAEKPNEPAEKPVEHTEKTEVEAQPKPSLEGATIFIHNKSKLMPLLFLLLILLIAGGGGAYWYMNRPKPKPAATAVQLSEPQQPTPKQDEALQTYTDEIGKFTVQYPKDWKAVTEKGSQGEDAPTTATTFTAPSGYKLIMAVDYGGRGGDCQPGPKDKPHAAGNQCPTMEILSAEPIGETVLGRYIDEMDKPLHELPIQLLHFKYTKPDGTTSYHIGWSEQKLAVNKPEMGAEIPLQYLQVESESGNFTHEIVFNADPGSSETFYQTAEAKQVEAIMKSFRFQR